jgi:site-specific DNA-adenine methylase
LTQPKTGGGQANYTGTVLQQFIEARLVERGYTYVDRRRFEAARYLEQPFYTRQFFIGKSIYDTNLYCDFIVYHPDKHPNCLVIESKWQQSAGSVDEKYPYLILNINTRYPYQTVIVLDGAGYKGNAEKWLRSQVGNNVRAVYNMRQFATWVNNGGL